MYSAFRSSAERLLRIPTEPEPPPGDEGTARVFRAAPNFYKYLLLLWALKSFAAAAAVLPMIVAPLMLLLSARSKLHGIATILLSFPVVILAIIVVLRLFALAVVRLDFENRWYLVTDRSLRVREGILSVREMTVTFANIQNISISQGPVQRAIGIADLRVDTAGGGSASDKKQAGQDLHTAWFRGVDNADEIRGLVQARLRQWKDSGLGDHEELAAPDIPAPQVITALRDVAAEATALRNALELRRS